VSTALLFFEARTKWDIGSPLHASRRQMLALLHAFVARLPFCIDYVRTTPRVGTLIRVASEEDISMADLLNSRAICRSCAHDVCTGWGRQGFLDVEVVFMLDAAQQGAFSFQLRTDSNESAPRGDGSPAGRVREQPHGLGRLLC
jgi:hypothetical protein